MKLIDKKPRKDNDSLNLINIMRELGVSELQMMKMMNCSDVVYNWTNGYRLIPKSFRRFILALVFIHRQGKTEEFQRFVKLEERSRGW
ncbi:hypothetical protein BRM13313_00038 [Salmonella phage BRM 13313]|nr:hypothetical protein BRM13313_00038 [Salmonella phage BRM 13313]